MTTLTTDLITTTRTGKVQGFVDRGTVAFKGIPFGASTAGQRRFKAPEPPEAWTGVRPCLEPGPACPQYSDMASKRYRAAEDKSEDCLYLNVWTPGLDDARRPVIIFFHGGGYQSGSGAVPVYNGAATARKGAVLVTANYRLALFGFLHLEEFFPEYAGSGNAGLLDQVRALEWIQENITNFGGDPANVTIFGSSAGGVTVATLMGMPTANGLFRRAVPASSAPGMARSPDVAMRVAQRFLQYVGVKPGDTDALLALPTSELTLAPASSSIPDREPTGAAQSKLWEELQQATGTASGGLIGPVQDGFVLMRPPLEAVEAGLAAGIDLLTGTTSEEARGNFWKLTAPAPDPDLAAAATMHGSDESWDISRFFPDSQRPLSEIREVYAASLRASGRDTTDKDVYAAVSSDRMIVRSMKFAEAQSRHNPTTYMYRFSWGSPAGGGLLGAFHGMATPFLFDNLHEEPAWEAVLGTDPPQLLATNVNTALVHFAETGNPNHPGLPDWPGYEPTRRATMDFNVTSTIVNDPERERRRLYE